MRIAHALPFLAVTSWCSTTNAAGPQAPRVGRPSWPNSSRTLLTPLWLGRISIVSGVSTMGLCIVGIPARCAPTSPALNLRPRNRPPHHVTPLSGGWAVPVVRREGRLMVKANLVATLAVLIALRARDLVRTVALFGAVAVRVALAIAGT